jgi:thioredoxin 1
MYMAVKELNSGNFGAFIEEGVSVVDFSAEWCGPCKVLKPIFKEASGEGGEYKFGSVDVDKESELAQKFQVMSVPTIIFFKNSEQVDRFTGVMTKEELLKKSAEILK